MELKNAPEEGTVIRATMRPQDLIPAFRKELIRLVGQDRAIGLLRTHEWRSDAPDSWYETESCQIDAEALFTELDNLAPEGFYFGAHPGDGSDYGFWAEESE